MKSATVVFALVLLGFMEYRITEALQCYVCEDCIEGEELQEMQICGELPIEATAIPIVIPGQRPTRTTTVGPTTVSTPTSTIRNTPDSASESSEQESGSVMESQEYDYDYSEEEINSNGGASTSTILSTIITANETFTTANATINFNGTTPAATTVNNNDDSEDETVESEDTEEVTQTENNNRTESAANTTLTVASTDIAASSEDYSEEDYSENASETEESVEGPTTNATDILANSTIFNILNATSASITNSTLVNNSSSPINSENISIDEENENRIDSTLSTSNDSTQATATSVATNPIAETNEDSDYYVEYEESESVEDSKKRRSMRKTRQADVSMQYVEPVCYTIKLRVNDSLVTKRGCATLINGNNYLTCHSLDNGWIVDDCQLCNTNGCNKLPSITASSEEISSGTKGNTELLVKMYFFLPIVLITMSIFH